ncbi:hypothetical protein Tco_1027472 [Tanacetum coccineum]
MVADEGVPAEVIKLARQRERSFTRVGFQYSIRTLVGIKSPVLYLWGVQKVLQEPDLVRALNLSVQASEK